MLSLDLNFSIDNDPSYISINNDPSYISDIFNFNIFDDKNYKIYRKKLKFDFIDKKKREKILLSIIKHYIK